MYEFKMYLGREKQASSHSVNRKNINTNNDYVGGDRLQ